MARMSGRRLAGWAARTVQIRCTDDLGIARIAPRSSIGASAHTRTPAEADSVLAVRVGAGAAGRQLRGQLAPCSPFAFSARSNFNSLEFHAPCLSSLTPDSDPATLRSFCDGIVPRGRTMGAVGGGLLVSSRRGPQGKASRAPCGAFTLW